ncbi:MAG: nucleotidyltransferase [Nitrospinae bacterium]|nr:nucleotidyltransferase [Nitrospinota bacterium]
MDIQADFKELLKSFNAHNVEYMIVGGYALAFHGAPRFTGDLDIFIKPSFDNARRIVAALAEFGFGSMGLAEDDFAKEDSVVQLGVPPVRVDIISSITGVTWPDAFAGKVEGSYGDIPINFIGREQFIANKRAIGRKRDMADIEALGE